jgi:uncharacterized membrane protein
VSEAALWTILAMAAVTYATRASGLWLGRLLKSGSWLEHLSAILPGAILVSLVAPAIVSAGARGIVAGAATVAAAVRLRGNILVPMIVGVVVIWALRLV